MLFLFLFEQLISFLLGRNQINIELDFISINDILTFKEQQNKSHMFAK